MTILLLALAGLLLLFFPLDRIVRRRPMGVPDCRVDERDVMFSRAARTPGTAAYDDYYRRHPLHREIDDQLRSMPPVGSKGGRYHDASVSAEAEAWFARIDGIRIDKELVDRWTSRIRASSDCNAEVRAMVQAAGAVAVGVAPVNAPFVYTHKGRFDGDYGVPVELDHPVALVFLVEMDHRTMQRAPRAQVFRESALQYYRAAQIAFMASAVLRSLGYDAIPQYDAHYDVILPPLAVAAGLGELGRNNILVADRYGSRVRIGAIATDMPLRCDAPVRLGVEEFCRICRKCADNCPSAALTKGQPESIRGVRKWPTAVEKCYRFWRIAGSDCGICMAVCPFSHKDTWFHNVVRLLIRLNPWMRWLAFQGERLIYGRTWRSTRSDIGP